MYTLKEILNLIVIATAIVILILTAFLTRADAMVLPSAHSADCKLVFELEHEANMKEGFKPALQQPLPKGQGVVFVWANGPNSARALAFVKPGNPPVDSELYKAAGTCTAPEGEYEVFRARVQELPK